MGKAKVLKDLLHSSPHHFDKFDHQHMGSGEGAQVFGWGSYLSEGEPVQKYYRQNFIREKAEEVYDKLVAPREVMTRYGGAIDLPFQSKYMLAEAVRRQLAGLDSKSVDDVVNRIIAGERQYFESIGVSPKTLKETVIDMADDIRASGDLDFDPAIGIYRVNFNASPDDLINLDNPLLDKANEPVRGLLSDSYKDVRQARKKIDELKAREREQFERSAKIKEKFNNGLLTRDELNHLLYDAPDAPYKLSSQYWSERTALERGANAIEEVISSQDTPDSTLDAIKALESFTSPRQVSESLLERGKKGSGYLDQPSRAMGHGTKNYVAFDDKDLEITSRERGAADPKALAALAAMTAATPQGRSLGGYIGNYIGGGVTGTLDSLAGLADWASTSNTKPSYTDRGGYIPAGERIEALDTISETLADLSERAKAWKEKKFGKNKIASTAGEILLGL